MSDAKKKSAGWNCFVNSSFYEFFSSTGQIYDFCPFTHRSCKGFLHPIYSALVVFYVLAFVSFCFVQPGVDLLALVSFRFGQMVFGQGGLELIFSQKDPNIPMVPTVIIMPRFPHQTCASWDIGRTARGTWSMPEAYTPPKPGIDGFLNKKYN